MCFNDNQEGVVFIMGKLSVIFRLFFKSQKHKGSSNKNKCVFGGQMKLDRWI